MLSNAAVANTAVSCNAGAQANMVAPFNGLKSISAFPASKKNNGITSIANNGGRVQCMQVCKKFETLSYVPPLSDTQ